MSGGRRDYGKEASDVDSWPPDLVGVPAARLYRRLAMEFEIPKIVLTHAVKDVDTWLKGKAERVAMFSPFASNVTDHVAMDGSNNVAISADIHDMASAQAILASPSPEQAAAAERHGVIQPVMAHIEK